MYFLVYLSKSMTSFKFFATIELSWILLTSLKITSTLNFSKFGL